MDKDFCGYRTCTFAVDLPRLTSLSDSPYINYCDVISGGMQVNDVSSKLRAIADQIDGYVEAPLQVHDDRTFKYRSKTPRLDFGRIAKIIYNARRSREKEIGIEGLFSDPAWDILLDLLINETENRRVSITSACIASCVPSTTALRWLSTLEEYGLVERVEDKSDARRTFVRLTQIGRKKVCAAIESNVEAGRS